MIVFWTSQLIFQIVQFCDFIVSHCWGQKLLLTTCQMLSLSANGEIAFWNCFVAVVTLGAEILPERSAFGIEKFWSLKWLNNSLVVGAGHCVSYLWSSVAADWAGETGHLPAGALGTRFPVGPVWGPSLQNRTSSLPSPLNCAPQKQLEEGDKHIDHLSTFHRKQRRWQNRKASECQLGKKGSSKLKQFSYFSADTVS